MSEPELPQSRYGRERTCPHCGTRVAQRAHTCFFCGASLDDAPRRRVAIPWADIVLFLVIGGVLALWWTRSPAPGSQIASSGGSSVLATAARTTAARTTAARTTAARTTTPTAAPSPTSLPPTATLEPVATPLPTPLRYKVQPGDTLELIAGLHGSTIADIMQANELDANGFIRVGDELLIPVSGPSSGPGPSPTPSGGTLVYTVQRGDTIQSIAMRFGSQIEWILVANRLTITALLQINQSLLVPLSMNPPTPTPTVQATQAPTVTPGPRFRAPDLLLPPEDSKVTGNAELLLTWTSVGVLEKDQWYVVTLEAPGGAKPIAPYWTKSTSWRLSPEYRNADQHTFTWQVQVFSGAPGEPGESLSPPSTPRSFAWR